jgi:hypothetical protein
MLSLRMWGPVTFPHKALNYDDRRCGNLRCPTPWESDLLREVQLHRNASSTIDLGWRRSIGLRISRLDQESPFTSA